MDASTFMFKPKGIGAQKQGPQRVAIGSLCG